MRRNARRSFLMSFAIVALLLSGCMYPGEEKAARENPYEEQLQSVQKAVDAYAGNNGGLLPIKTKEQATEEYIKYPVEFSKLAPAYMEKIPSNAYEVGGIYQYVLTNVEETPQVKLVDLRVAERIRELNLRKQINGKVPFKDAIGDNVYEVDFEKMGYEEPIKIPSPYSDAQLPLVVGGDGHFYIDYSIDLGRILEKEKPDVKPGDDIRYLLAEDYPILPAYSLPYTVDDKNQVIFMRK